MRRRIDGTNPIFQDRQKVKISIYCLIMHLISTSQIASICEKVEAHGPSNRNTAANPSQGPIILLFHFPIPFCIAAPMRSRNDKTASPQNRSHTNTKKI
jgi:hypothetical protein